MGKNSPSKSASFSQSGVVLVSGLPEDEWTEADIEKLVQPFGTPSGIIIAKQIGKVGSEHER